MSRLVSRGDVMRAPYSVPMMRRHHRRNPDSCGAGVRQGRRCLCDHIAPWRGCFAVLGHALTASITAGSACILTMSE